MRYSLGESTNYVVSDIRVTTRKLQVNKSARMPGKFYWKTFDFQPLSDTFDESKGIEDTDDFRLFPD